MRKSKGKPSSPSPAIAAAATASNHRRVTTALLRREVSAVASSPLARRVSQSSGDRRLAMYVLVGGESHGSQGVSRDRRELCHTSLAFVGAAYEELRSGGIPKEQIITIVQLNDYLDGLREGATGAWEQANGMPARYYDELIETTTSKCARLVAEGGADYDYEDVNPWTVWRCVLGLGEGKVVRDASSIFLGIYTHGDNHPTVRGAKEQDTMKNEWYAHMPYECPDAGKDSMYAFVAMSEAKGAPFNYLYGSQLRAMFAQLFAEDAERPVVALLNYCLSGGNLEFMRNPVARRAYGADDWPLFLMCSSQPGQDSLVAGLWESWFARLGSLLRSGAEDSSVGGDADADVQDGGPPLMDFYLAVKRDYHEKNAYELVNKIKSLAYPSIGAYVAFKKEGESEREKEREREREREENKNESNEISNE